MKAYPTKEDFAFCKLARSNQASALYAVKVVRLYAAGQADTRVDERDGVPAASHARAYLDM